MTAPTRIDPAPVPELAERSAVALVEIRRRRRRPWLVATGLGVAALVALVALLAPTTSGLTQKLADVCTAAGPSVPADAALDCAQAQRGEVPVRAAGVPGLDGAVTEAPVTIAPERPGAPVTVVYPPGPGSVPGAASTAPAPGPVVTVPGPVVTVTSPVPAAALPRDTVTVAAPPPVVETEPRDTVTLAAPPPVVETETVTVEPEAPAPVTTTTTVTETVTITAEPGPAADPAPTGEQPSPVAPSGDPSPAPGTEPVQPDPVLPPSPVAVASDDGQDEQRGLLERLLGLGLGM